MGGKKNGRIENICVFHHLCLVERIENIYVFFFDNIENKIGRAHV